MKYAAGILPYSVKTGRFLIAKRGPNINDPNVWTSFGGKRDNGETSYQTALREFREESGYIGQIKVMPNPISVVNNDGFKFVQYIGEVQNEFTPPMLNKQTVDGMVEVAGYMWITEKQLKSMINHPKTHKGFNNYLRKKYE